MEKIVRIRSGRKESGKNRERKPKNDKAGGQRKFFYFFKIEKDCD